MTNLHLARPLPGFALLVALTCAPVPAAADTFGFSCITSNNPADCATLASQITMLVTPTGSNQVNIAFQNDGSQESSITDVYFDDLQNRLLYQPGQITSSTGVSFSYGCSPGNLPGGQSLGFSTSYCADSNSPVQPMGVNPGEWVNFVFSLSGSTTFAMLINAINSGAYRVGVHVQGFAGGGSEGGISRVPEAPVVWALVLGTCLAAVQILRRARLN